MEQNLVINAFTVFTVILAPPTLLAGIWGMNFKYMPELSWPWGYAIALIAMLISAILPYRFVRKMGWL